MCFTFIFVIPYSVLFVHFVDPGMSESDTKSTKKRFLERDAAKRKCFLLFGKYMNKNEFRVLFGASVGPWLGVFAP